MSKVLLLLILCTTTRVFLTTSRPLAANGDPVPAPQRREVYADGRMFDISHRVTKDLPSWDSKEGLGQFLFSLASIKNGSVVNASEMKMSVHTGTHVDAPSHMFDNYSDAGFDADSLDLEVLNAEVMMSLNIPKGVRRVLFRTLNTDRQVMGKKEFDSSYVGFMKDGAKWLVENTDIKLVGLDYLSVAAYVEVLDTHLEFLASREIILVEGLKLDNIQPGLYTLHCLPIRLLGAVDLQQDAFLSNNTTKKIWKPC